MCRRTRRPGQRADLSRLQRSHSGSRATQESARHLRSRREGCRRPALGVGDHRAWEKDSQNTAKEAANLNIKEDGVEALSGVKCCNSTAHFVIEARAGCKAPQEATTRDVPLRCRECKVPEREGMGYEFAVAPPASSFTGNERKGCELSRGIHPCDTASGSRGGLMHCILQSWGGYPASHVFPKTPSASRYIAATQASLATITHRSPPGTARKVAPRGACVRAQNVTRPKNEPSASAACMSG